MKTYDVSMMLTFLWKLCDVIDLSLAYYYICFGDLLMLVSVNVFIDFFLYLPNL